MNTKSEITQIFINGQKVGVLGLNSVFAAVNKLDIKNEEMLKDEIVNRAKKVNYIPDEAFAEYRKSLYNEYRKYTGEKIDTGSIVNEIRILGPGCQRCDELMRRVMSAVAELKITADVQHVHEMRKISEYGPIPTPALVVNGEIVLVGKVPSIEKLKKLFCKC